MADALDLRDRFSDLATAGNLNEALTLVRAVVRANRTDVLIRCAAVRTSWLHPRSHQLYAIMWGWHLPNGAVFFMRCVCSAHRSCFLC